jgi:hypothetical protein
MTTYLATPTLAHWREEMTLTFCSRACREQASYDGGWTIVNRLDDDRYEFEETCQECADVIPASPLRRAVDLGYLYSDVGHGGPFELVDHTPTPPLKL